MSVFLIFTNPVDKSVFMTSIVGLPDSPLLLTINVLSPIRPRIPTPLCERMYMYKGIMYLGMNVLFLRFIEV